MYAECIKCQKLGISCDGPNFVAMPAPELVAWCKERKNALGWTNAKLAEMANMAKGTVDGLLAGKHPEFKYESVRPLVKALVGGEWKGNPCPAPDTEDEKYIETAERLAAENEKLKAYILKAEEHFRDEYHATKSENIATIEFLREQLRFRKKAIIALSVALGVALSIIITALIIDKLNPEIGFFWTNLFSQFRANVSSFAGSKM